MSTINPQETRIIYHIDDEETPYLVKLNVPHSEITLSDFKAVLNVPKPNYKYFFKSLDDDFGVVKEEIIDDEGKLPIFKGRVVAWVRISCIKTQTPLIMHAFVFLVGDCRWIQCVRHQLPVYGHVPEVGQHANSSREARSHWRLAAPKFSVILLSFYYCFIYY